MIPYHEHKVLYQTTIDLGFTSVHWVLPFYTIMMAIGIFAGLLVLYNKYRLYNKYLLFKIFILSTIFTMIGGRFFYLIFYKTPNPWYLLFIETFKIWKVGMVSVSGLIFLIITLMFILPRNKIDFLKALDNLSPAFAIGLFFARIGCFLAGCCYGQNTDVFFWNY